jgi:7,8-dihydropterin-6-yl-methyl-4-(beta-D-ribofuranosyl)aminobenzene 5'-phosphate synthase
MKARSWLANVIATLVLLLSGCTTTTSPPAAAGVDSTKAQITVLYDAFGKSSTMQKDWGYAALIEYGGKRILFDTGNNGDILAQNAKAKGIDLSKLDFVVMSHRHGDYMGGLALSPWRESQGEDLCAQGGFRRVWRRLTEHLLSQGCLSTP